MHIESQQIHTNIYQSNYQSIINVFLCSDLGAGEPAEEEGVHGQPREEVRAHAGRGQQMADQG